MQITTQAPFTPSLNIQPNPTQSIFLSQTPPTHHHHQGGPAAGRVTEEGVAYLEVKQQLLLNYCINLTYYLLLKAEGKPVRDHPVMVQLLELRAAFEKLRPLDAKLKFHIDRLLRVAEMSREALAGGQGKGAAGRDPLSFRPNPDALLGKGGGAGEEEEGESEGEGDGGAAGGVYRPPRLAAVPYEEDGGKGKGKGKDGEQLRKSLEKLRRSEILQTLTEQFSERPEMVSEGASAGALERRRREEEEARRAYEEERFVRLVTSKKEKKLRKAAERESGRLETIADVGDFHELEASLAALGDAGAAARAAAGKLRKASSSKASTDVAGASALQRAVNSLAQKERSTKRRREREMTGDADVPYRNPDEIRVSASVRRPAPEEGDMGMDAADAAALAALSGGGVGGRRAGKKGRVAVDMEEVGAREPVEEDAYYEAVAGKRRAKRAEKEGLYAVEPTYGAREDELGDGEKRGINYQILKNRGLTAYKAKLNRNPRVKKREAFRKATIRRKGQVREVRASEAAGYGGEATGINARVVRVRGKK